MTPHATTADEVDQPRRGRLELPHVGPVLLRWSTRGLLSLSFGLGPPRRGVEAAVHRGVEAAVHRGVDVWDDVPGAFSGPLLDLVFGDGASARTLVTASSGTPFQERVWAALRLVPRGSVVTYADLAASIGIPRGTRAVGAAMARNPLPLVVPCHRVIAAGGRLGGFSAGLEMKRLLLELEGVHVEGGRVGPGRAHGSTRPTRS